MDEKLARGLCADRQAAIYRLGLYSLYADQLEEQGETALAGWLRRLSKRERRRLMLLWRRLCDTPEPAALIANATQSLFLGGVVGREELSKKANEAGEKPLGTLLRALSMAARLDDQKLCQLLDSLGAQHRHSSALWRCERCGAAMLYPMRPEHCELCGAGGGAFALEGSE